MKNRNILALVFIFSLLAIPFSYTWGQEKLTKQQEKEFRAQQEELKAMQEEMMKAKEDEHKRAAELYRTYDYRKGTGYTALPSIPSIPTIGWMTGGSENSFSLSLRKSFKGESISKETSFTVDDDQSRIRFNVKGRCEEGKIIVKFILPSGKSFTEIQIDSSADIEWSQSLTMEKESIYKGQWKVEVKAVKAKGMYEANIKSY